MPTATVRALAHKPQKSTIIIASVTRIINNNKIEFDTSRDQLIGNDKVIVEYSL